jgi:hypothetical protein
MDERFRFPPPSQTVKRGDTEITLHLCAVCSRFAAREIAPRTYKCYLCKAKINYIPQKDKQEKSPNGSHAD